MSYCSVNKFTITRGVDNTFVFVIKEDGTTLPLALQPSDTFVAYLKELGTDTTALTKSLSIEDANSGKVKLVVTEAEANLLVPRKGTEVDRYYVKPSYKLVIDCSTVGNGDFIAKVNEVYVD